MPIRPTSDTCARRPQPRSPQIAGARCCHSAPLRTRGARATGQRTELINFPDRYSQTRESIRHGRLIGRGIYTKYGACVGHRADTPQSSPSLDTYPEVISRSRLVLCRLQASSSERTSASEPLRSLSYDDASGRCEFRSAGIAPPRGPVAPAAAVTPAPSPGAGSNSIAALPVPWGGWGEWGDIDPDWSCGSGEIRRVLRIRARLRALDA